MREVCRRWDTTLAAAALRFSTRDERFASTIVGISKPERIQQTLDAASLDRPQEFWDELESLVPAPANWLDADH